jgi:cyclic pyranopterin phosphate synthase
MEGEDRHRETLLKEMTVDEIIRIVRTAVDLGISKVKLTGGEPLIRDDVAEIVKRIAALPNLADLSMTTNGTLFASLAKELFMNGLKRVNISLPTLNAETFNKLTGGKIEDVLRGIRAAVEAGFHPVKLNMLVLECTGKPDFLEMVNFAQDTRAVLQLIELEPINISTSYYSANHKSLEEYENWLKQRAFKVEVRQYMQNRRIYHLPDVKVEVIYPTEDTGFCTHCTRLRLTSNGKLKPCLMRNDNLVDILKPLKDGASDKELRELFEKANQSREPYNMN